MVSVNDPLQERETLLRRRKLLKNQIGSHNREFNSMAMLVKARDPYGAKTLKYLKGSVPRVSTVSWMQLLKTLSLDGLCHCLLRVPRHDKYLRKAIICLIAIKRLEQLDKRVATLLSQLQDPLVAAVHSRN